MKQLTYGKQSVRHDCMLAHSLTHRQTHTVTYQWLLKVSKDRVTEWACIQFPRSLRHYSNCISFLVASWLFVVYICRPYTTWSGCLSIPYAQYDNHNQWTDAHERYNLAFQPSKSVTVLLERYGQGVEVFQCQLANCIQVCSS